MLIMEFKDGTKIETLEGGSIYDTYVEIETKDDILKLKRLVTDENVETIRFYRDKEIVSTFEHMKVSSPIDVDLIDDKLIAHIYLNKMDAVAIELAQLKEMTEIQNQAIMELAEMAGEQNG